MGERRNVCIVERPLKKKGIIEKIGVYMDLGGHGSSSR
jgi:hypothetical protein